MNMLVWLKIQHHQNQFVSGVLGYSLWTSWAVKRKDHYDDRKLFGGQKIALATSFAGCKQIARRKIDLPPVTFIPKSKIAYSEF